MLTIVVISLLPLLFFAVFIVIILKWIGILDDFPFLFSLFAIVLSVLAGITVADRFTTRYLTSGNPNTITVTGIAFENTDVVLILDTQPDISWKQPQNGLLRTGIKFETQKVVELQCDINFANCRYANDLLEKP